MRDSSVVKSAVGLAAAGYTVILPSLCWSCIAASEILGPPSDSDDDVLINRWLASRAMPQRACCWCGRRGVGTGGWSSIKQHDGQWTRPPPCGPQSTVLRLFLSRYGSTLRTRNRWKVTVEFDGFRMCQKSSKFDSIRIWTSSHP